MKRYRLYFLRAGRIYHRVDLDCEDDEAALAAVEDHGPLRERELWEGARLVRRWDKDGAS